MKTDIWMPIYIGDYLKDTMHLTTEEHGAYFLILMDIWNKNGWVNPSPKYLSRIARVSEEKWIKEIRPSIAEFFREDESGLTQDRLLSELEKSKNRRELAQENGKKGGRPKTQKEPNGKPQGKPIANLTPNPEKSSSPSPSPSPSQSTAPSIKRKRFTAPTLEEIQEYVTIQNYNVNPESFINHYEGIGWMVGKNKMQKWKSVIAGWHSRNKDKNGGKSNVQPRTFTELKEQKFIDTIGELHIRSGQSNHV